MNKILQVLLLITCQFLSISAWAQVKISPIKTYLKKELSTSYNITNQSNQKMTFDVKAYAWTQTLKNELFLQQDNKVLVYPPILEIEPQKTKTIRLIFNEGHAQFYRLMVIQKPQNKFSEVSFNLSISLPIFFEATSTPLMDRKTIFISRVRNMSKDCTFKVTNNGTQYDQIKEYRWKDKNNKVTKKIVNTYILPKSNGGELELSSPVCPTSIVFEKANEVFWIP